MSCLVTDVYSVMFINNSCIILYDDVEYATGELNNGLYTLNLSNQVLCLNRKRKSNDSLLWHHRLSHISDKRIAKLVKEGLVDLFDPDSLGTCESCIKGKIAKTPFLGKGQRAKDLLELIHSDVCGPISV